jgi:hypothetical protein
MNPKLLKALILWIEIVCSMLLYQSNIFPENQRVDLHKATAVLTAELKKQDVSK